MKLARKLDDLIAKHDELQNQLASQTDMGGQEYARLSRELTELTDVVKAAERYRATEAEIRDLESLVNDSGSDSDVKALAEEEFRELKQLLPKLEREIQLLLLPKYTADKKMLFLKSEQELEAKKPLFLRQICSGCISDFQNIMTGPLSL